MPALTPMVKNIILWNVGIWLLQTFAEKLFFSWQGDPLFSVSVGGILQGYLWQPFTYMWLHEPKMPFHVMLNMLTLYMFGGELERVWGPRRFLRFYLLCGVGAGLLIPLWNWIWGIDAQTLGASGAVFGVLTAFALRWPDRQIMLLFPPIPMRAIWLIPTMFVALYVFAGNANVSHVAHLGGVLVALVLMRDEAQRTLNMASLRHRWNRYRMRGRLRAVRRDEWERRRRDDDDRPTYH